MRMTRLWKNALRRIATPCLSVSLALVLGLGTAQAQGHCEGVDLIAQMPAQERARITEIAHAAPYAQGLLWRATRDGQEVVIAGTYHFDDPRHSALVTRLLPALDQAASVLVEAGPKEEAQLKSELMSRPDLMFDPDGPTLPELLPDPDWQRLMEAFEARGIPPVFAAKFKPWYAAITISMSPCALRAISEGAVGLDKKIVAAAQAHNLPIRALEPYDTAFHLFDDISEGDQRDLLRGALAVEGKSDDMTFTLANAYFDGETRLIWAFSDWLARQDKTLPPEVIEKQLELSEEKLMVERNRAWIPVIEAASATSQGKPVLMAAGALHLAGEGGVLNLLAARGWDITPY